MKNISSLLLIVGFCSEIFAGRVGRHTPFPDDTAAVRKFLSKKTKEELQASQKSLEARLEVIMKSSCKQSIEELLVSAAGLEVLFLSSHLRDVTIVLACKLQEEERLKRAFFANQTLESKSEKKPQKRPFIKQGKVIKNMPKHKHR